MNLLVQNKLIKKEQAAEIRQAAELVKNGVEQIIIDRNLVDTEELARIKAGIFGIPYQSLLDEKIDDNVLYLIPIAAAENYKIICFAKTDNKIKVGILNPDNFKAVEAVDFLAKKDGLQVEYFLISSLSFATVLKQYKTLGKEVSSALQTKKEEDKKEGAVKAKKKSKEVELEEVVKSAPVAKIVSVIIRHAIEGRASDIHIEPSQKESRVRYRIDGVLRTSLVLPKEVHNAIVARIKVLANMKLDETRVPQDGRYRVTANDKEIDLRISILPLIDDEKVVMRILDTTRGAPTLDDLGYQGASLEIIKRNIQKTDGMFLITGPTGSGKSTTLFSILNIVNKEGINISTLEDPVEYYVKGVNQSQVRPEVGFSFSTGLRSLLRQDPDVIMVGEIRDSETAELAIHASLTGHFVLSTLHTNDAIGAVPRLLDMKVEPFLLGSTLNTVVGQRLGRRICSHCKTEESVPEDVLANIKNELNKTPPDAIKNFLPNLDLNKLVFYKGSGCPRCGNTGYSGRIALAEVLDINNDVKNMIMDMGKTRSFKLEDVLKTQQFITMKQDGIIKALQGITTLGEIMRVIFD